MNSAPFYLPQAQLEAAETESLRRLARYLKLNNFKELEHYELAWVLSMIAILISRDYRIRSIPGNISLSLRGLPSISTILILCASE
jgi:hypothetical protein